MVTKAFTLYVVLVEVYLPLEVSFDECSIIVVAFPDHGSGTDPEVLKFDQPLWFKALMIVENEPENSDIKQVVLRLRGLHIEMSFLGSIGRVMAGSGLQELLEVKMQKMLLQSRLKSNPSTFHS